MPICKLITNLATKRIPQEFEALLSTNLSTILEKPIETITVMVQPETRMYRSGSNEDTAYMKIWSIARFNKDTNPVYHEKLVTLIHKQLGIPKERIVISLHDLKPEEVYPGLKIVKTN